MERYEWPSGHPNDPFWTLQADDIDKMPFDDFEWRDDFIRAALHELLRLATECAGLREENEITNRSLELSSAQVADLGVAFTGEERLRKTAERELAIVRAHRNELQAQLTAAYENGEQMSSELAEAKKELSEAEEAIRDVATPKKWEYEASWKRWRETPAIARALARKSEGAGEEGGG